MSRHTHLRLDDGPSLVLTAKGVATSRVPLARISHLVTPAGCGLHENVLLACARRNITIVWQDKHGAPLAVLFGSNHGQPVPWAERIHAAISRPEWNERYTSWYAAQCCMARKSLARRCGFVGDGLRGRAWFNGLLSHIEVPRSVGMAALSEWESSALALLTEHWHAIQVPTDVMIHPAAGVNIAGDMARCLAFGMVANGLMKRREQWCRIPLSNREIVHYTAASLFERHRGEMLHLVAAFHARFHRWLLGLESWH
ncbi:MAG: CRISPR-associated endonuclease Cas1 [Mariprofundales bacterium]|nr:CRISPR-associated endonuclease Cas1 [Mariprofundales bacterium]